LEWIQNKRSETWDLREVDSRLKTQIGLAFAKVRDAARQHGVSNRTAALAVAVRRLDEAYFERGIFP
jgi:glutamate dehydrogenase (NAD(P)+)